MEPTPRLLRRVRADFAPDEAKLVLSALAELDLGERVEAAVVKLGAGDLDRLDRALQEARIDWRDVLVMAGLAHEDWSQRLDDYLGRDG